jgi:hypothetical protein
MKSTYGIGFLIFSKKTQQLKDTRMSLRNQIKSLTDKIFVPQTFSGIGMTSAAVGGTIDSIGPIPYALSLLLGVGNIIHPANANEENPILRQLRRPETASHLMMVGASYNAIENSVRTLDGQAEPLHMALTAYWSLAALAHYKMGELQSANNNAQHTPPNNSLDVIARNPGNIFIPMNLILASLPLMMNGSLETSVTSFISLACTIAAGAHLIKKSSEAAKGDIPLSGVNDGIVNKWNMGVCGANAAGFLMTAFQDQNMPALAMGIASLAFAGTNYKLMKIFTAPKNPSL